MIEYLRGRLIKNHPAGVILDVHGIGYGVSLPLRALMQLPKLGSELELWVYTRVREDAIQLYGFLSYEDRFGFEFLLQVSGVGPKAALAVFSGLTFDDLVEILRFRQIERLQSVPGLGKKTAEKIVFELEGKVDKLIAASMGSLELKKRPTSSLGLEEATASAQRSVLADLRSALLNLGYKEKDLRAVLERVCENAHQQEFSDLLRQSLRFLTQPSP